jgi:hypothetical protein
MSTAIGVGPSLYLITLKYLAVLFFILSGIGFMPMFFVDPVSVHFGNYSDKSVYYSEVNKSISDHVIKCEDETKIGFI